MLHHASTAAPLLPLRCSKEVASFRVAASIRGKRAVPCLLIIQLSEGDEGKEGASPATMHLYRAGVGLLWLQGGSGRAARPC